jgi:hypothetical protein
MGNSVVLPDDFGDYVAIENASQRFNEASDVAKKVTAAGVQLHPNLDHAAIFCDPPYIVAGPLKQLGYISGWDARCYPSPVDECDYINVSARLPEDSIERGNGWFDYVAVVHPVDAQALNHMLSQGYGNPFIHHLTWGIVPPERADASDFDYAGQVVRFMVGTRPVIADAIGNEPGTLIIALPQEVIDRPDFADVLPTWVDGLEADQYQVESMQGGGFLIQFFVLTGGRIEVALRSGTTQTFNPKSVHKISKDEISAIQDDG